MLFKVFGFALLSGLAVAVPDVEKRVPQATSPQDFSSAVAQLVSLYIPASVATPVGAAIAGAISATGDVQAAVLSALAAPTPPPFISAVPSQYSKNIVSLESAISALRGVASSGIAGAPIVSTDSTGKASTVSTKNAVQTTDSAGKSIVALTGSTGVTSTLPTSTASTTQTASTTTTSTGTATSTAGGSAAPSSSKAAGIPVALAPGAGGLLGLVGLVLAL